VGRGEKKGDTEEGFAEELKYLSGKRGERRRAGGKQKS